jgi:putative pyruvate formate lyase activating enzyme
VLEWIAAHLPKNTYLNLMSQYRPEHDGFGDPRIGSRLTRDEYREAVGWARDAGLTNLDVQGWYFF